MRRGLAWLLALLLCLAPAAVLAAKPQATNTPSPYPEATLPKDAPEYDPDHPEDLVTEQLYAWSAVLIEADTGKVIFEKNADDIRYPASTTKIMTVFLGIVMMDSLDFDVTVSETAAAVNNTDDDISSMNLQAGEVIGYEDLLYGTMLLSANDGANVIAETVAGSIENFVDLMNRMAQTMGCTNTHFANPHGLHDDAHYTTPRDLAVITWHAMQNETFASIAGTKSWTIAKTNLHRARTAVNTNELFNPGTEEKPNKNYYPRAIGVKTGFTSPAQYCFVGAAEKDNVNLISVVMYTGKRARWADTIKLMDYGFSQYVSITPVDLYNMNPMTIEISSYATDDANMGRLPLICRPSEEAAAEDIRIVATQEEIELKARNLKETVLIQYTRDFQAPVDAGEVMGTMTYFLEDGTPAVYYLTASRSIAKRANAPKTLDQIVAETYADPNPLPPFSVDLLLIFLTPLALVFLIGWLIGRHRRKVRHRRRQTPRITHRYLK